MSNPTASCQRLTLFMAITALAAAPVAHAACTYPQEITIPDGATATKEQMVAGQQAVKDFIAAIDTYEACLDEEEKALGDAVTEEQRQVHAKRHNAAEDAKLDVADRFNQQVRAFKAQGTE
jgi:hypothetical protein